ncbi:hypothetical protein BDD12DRAFT_60025 [Trichophaea hybrida]|nr:hypothetical protein BDD12DRAFT_60025 [Trichophaea hybrida]
MTYLSILLMSFFGLSGSNVLDHDSYAMILSTVVLIVNAYLKQHTVTQTKCYFKSCINPKIHRDISSHGFSISPGPGPTSERCSEMLFLKNAKDCYVIECY